MRYEEFYKKKQLSHQRFLRQLKLMPLYALALGILITFLTLFFVSGTPYKNGKLIAECGSSFDAPSSFMGQSKYQFFVDGNWQEELPQFPGEYKCRIVSEGLFGRISHHKAPNVTINKKNIEVICDSNKVEYGKIPSVTADVLKGDTIVKYDLIYDSVYLAKTKVEIDPESVVIEDENGIDVTSRYQIETHKTDIEFTKAPITIVVIGDRKTYDGTALTSDDYIVDGNLMDGDEVIVTFDGAITYAGECENTISDIKVLSNGVENPNYRFNIEPGYLTVEPMEIEFSTRDFSFDYDGKYHLFDDVVCEQEIPDEIVITPIEILKAGEYKYSPSYKMINKNNEDVTDSYNVIEYFDYTLTCRPFELELTILDNEFEYDGNDYEFKQISLNREIPDNLTIRPLKVLEPDDIEYKLVYYIETADKIDVTDSYIINEPFEHKITCKRIKLGVSTEDVKFTYDGTVHTFDSIILDRQIANKLVVSAPVEALFADTYDYIPEFDILNDDNESVLALYDIVPNFGTITCKPMDIILSSEEVHIPYDGKQHTYEEIICDKEIPDTIIVQRGVDVLNANEYTYSPRYVIRNSNNINVTSSYNITPSFGKVIVDQFELTITTNSLEYTYDSNEHVYFELDGNGNYKDIILDREIPDNFSISELILYDADIYEFKQEYSIKNNSGRDVKGNYKIIEEFGTINIKPIELSLSSLSDEFSYDGDEHIYNTITLDREIPDNFIVSDLFIKTPGDYFNAPEYIIENSNGDNVTGNYLIDTNWGNIRVLRYVFDIDISSLRASYNSTNRFNILLNAPDIKEFRGADLFVWGTTDQVNVGECIFTYGGYSVIKGADDISNCYKINMINTVIDFTINKQSIVASIVSGEKEYDGDIYQTRLAEVTSGDIHGNSIVIISSSSSAEPGSYDLVPDLDPHGNRMVYIYDDYANDVTANYDILVTKGQCNINRRKISLIPRFENIPNNQTYVDENYELKGELYPGDRIEMGYSYEVNYGFNPVELIPSVFDASDNDRSNYYDFDIRNGGFTREKIKINVTVVSKTVAYTGRDVYLEFSSFAYDASLLDENEYIVFDYRSAGSIRNVGTVMTELTIDMIEVHSFNDYFADCTARYEFEITQGYITIIPARITIVTGSNIDYYNEEEPLICHEYEIYGITSYYFDVEIEFTGSLNYVGTVNNTVSSINIINTFYEIPENVTGCFIITLYEGTLTYLEGSAD